MVLLICGLPNPTWLCSISSFTCINKSLDDQKPLILIKRTANKTLTIIKGKANKSLPIIKRIANKSQWKQRVQISRQRQWEKRDITNNREERITWDRRVDVFRRGGRRRRRRRSSGPHRRALPSRPPTLESPSTLSQNARRNRIWNPGSYGWWIKEGSIGPQGRRRMRESVAHTAEMGEKDGSRHAIFARKRLKKPEGWTGGVTREFTIDFLGLPSRDYPRKGISHDTRFQA